MEPRLKQGRAHALTLTTLTSSGCHRLLAKYAQCGRGTFHSEALTWCGLDRYVCPTSPRGRSGECHQTYRSKKSHFIGLIPKVIETVLEI